jgi:hypothetical protein
LNPLTGQVVAPLLLQYISANSQLLTTLGTAIVGGVLLLGAQRMAELNNPHRGTLLAKWTLLATVVFETINILLGYLAQGALISSIPALTAASYLANEQVQNNNIAALDRIQLLTLLQFGAFL